MFIYIIDRYIISVTHFRSQASMKTETNELPNLKNSANESVEIRSDLAGGHSFLR